MPSLFGTAAILIGSFQSEVPSLWGDEIASLLSAKRSIPSLFEHVLGVVDAVHAVYYMLLHFWISAFGSTPFALRFLSAIFVGLAVAGTVCLAKLLTNNRVAFLTGLVALFLPRLTQIATEARSYAMSAALVTWLTVLLIWLLKRDRQSVWLWLLYSLAVAANLYVFLFSGLMLFAHLAIVLFNRKARQAIWFWLPAGLLGALLALPIIYFGFNQRGQVSWIEPNNVNFKTVVINPWFLSEIYSVGAAYVIGFLGLFLLLRKLSIKDKNRSISALGVGLAMSFIPAIVLLLGNRIIPMYLPRYLMISATGVAFLIGYLLSRIHPIAGLIGVVILTGLAAPDYAYRRTVYAKSSDFASIAKQLSARSEPGDAIIFDEESKVWPRMSTIKYAYPDAFKGLNEVAFLSSYEQTTWFRDYSYAIPTVAGKLASVQRVWVIEHRQPGQAASSYALQDLAKLGFTVSSELPDRYSVTYLLTRKLDPPRHQPGL